MNVPCRECGAQQSQMCTDGGVPSFTHPSRMNDEIAFLRSPVVIEAIGKMLDERLGRT